VQKVYIKDFPLGCKIFRIKENKRAKMKRLAVYALSALLASYTAGCSLKEIEKQRTRAERTSSLISKVRAEYDAVKESENSDSERNRNYRWEFQSLDRIPSDNTQKRLVCEGDCINADGRRNSVFYLSDDIALVGIKEYRQDLTGEIKRYHYIIEKYALANYGAGQVWKKEEDYLEKTTCVNPKTGEERNCTRKRKGFLENLLKSLK
jgi:hypothetical protein